MRTHAKPCCGGFGFHKPECPERSYVGLKRGKPPRARSTKKARDIRERKAEAKRREKEHTEAGTIPCVRCGKPAGVLHHVKRQGQGGTNDPANLLNLCEGPGSCHEYIHRNVTESKEEGWLA